MAFSRNCHGQGFEKCQIRVFDKVLSECPVGMLDEDLCDVANIVSMCEGGGFGGGRTLPSQLMEEMNYYWEVRSIVLSEERRIDRYKDSIKKDKK